MQFEKIKQKVIAQQIKLLEKGIKKFGSQTALAEIAGMKKQAINRYLIDKIEMRYSTYLYLYHLINGKKL